VARGSAALASAFGLATAILLSFIALPLVALFARLPIHDLAAELRSPVAVDALVVSVKTSTIAVALMVVLGTPAAYLLATRSFRGSSLVTTMLELPLVLPPAVAGLALFAAFGRFGVAGGALRAFGVELPFTQAAVVMALAFVASPFYVRQALAAFASVDPELLSAARTLGASEAAAFARVAVPLARSGLTAGVGLALARALGEFGATIMFAGSLQGRTQTLPLAIYGRFSAGDLTGAVVMAALLVAASGGLLVGVKVLVRRSGQREGRSWSIASRPASVIG
jgi:molybdate transport system permease protein